MARRWAIPRLSLLTAILFPPQAFTVLVNVTVDDAGTDPNTGSTFVYTPAGRWNYGPDCPGCTVQPDPSFIFDNSWHDATYNATFPGGSENETQVVSFSFEGSAIYVYGIIAHSAKPSRNAGMFFFIDGEQVGSFIQTPLPADSTADLTFTYNVPLYSTSSISNGQHTFALQNGQGQQPSLVLFDYIIYSHDDGTSPQSPTPFLTSAEAPSSTPSVSPQTQSPSPQGASSLSSPFSSDTSTAPTSPAASSTSPADLSSPGNTISKHTRTVIIACAIVGGVLIIIILLATTPVLYRRRAGAQRRLLEATPWVPIPTPNVPELVQNSVLGPLEAQVRLPRPGALGTWDSRPTARDNPSGASEEPGSSYCPPGTSTSALQQPARARDATRGSSSDMILVDGPPPYSPRHTMHSSSIHK
ncbi:hypothetical protein PHLCEN_2v5819 [Hermanssonia centrifuga]|uniref:Uncharacterized protein n=1 Tax=Hermanssonia centrifuga TaxID=98765 RepID=A0A2R6P1U3_9APHY|nr:hypothetical protein PHLCEN_2v5819 [Hermanssonia centrifuga]